MLQITLHERSTLIWPNHTLQALSKALSKRLPSAWYTLNVYRAEGRSVKTPRKYHWLARAFKLTLTTSSGTCLSPTRSRLMTCCRRRRCQTNLGPSSATKSRLSTCWSELCQISEWDGKLGLQSTGLERRALVQLQSSQPLESHWWSVHECAILS